MNTKQKLEAVKSTVVAGYKAELDMDAICGSVFMNKPEGVSFGDIPALVKKIGEDEGFIVPLAKRKELIQTEIDQFEEMNRSFKEIEEYISEIASEFDVPVAWVRNRMKAHYKNMEWAYPKKSVMSPIQAQIVECFRANPDIEKHELAECLLKHTDNAAKHANYYFELASALVKVGMEMK